ncbi:MAG: glycosyl hydrolase-related protein [Oscillospiraceae bacterium]|nr:glycosyl hydrolase-related protein [Oscillospiraceae bacterium]
MAHFDIPFFDKNSERKMLTQRVSRIIRDLEGRAYPDSEGTGGFMFRDGQYTFAQINEGEWRPFAEGEYWGYREQYCWFRQTVKVPERFAGWPVIYDINPFPDKGWDSNCQQFIIYVNGELCQGVDRNHSFVYLTDCAKGGETFDIALNAYCDDWDFRGQSRMSAALKTVDVNVRNLMYDLSVPLETAHLYDHDAMPRIEIVKAINEACNLLELNTYNYDAFVKSVLAASAYLDENLYGEGMDAVTSAIGHTHIDTAWLWRLRQTREKTGRSFASVLNLMKEFPEYKFMSPQAQLYDFVKQDYPEVYEQMKQRVKEGRWEVEGSMWVESDTNVISGESMVRQFLVGKRFFKQEFGVDNKIMWLPDVFGYSAALPQVMKLADIEYFMTTKISWNEYDKLPYDTFMWKGIDGTEILSHFIPSIGTDDPRHYQTTYNAFLAPEEVLFGWKRYSNKDLNKNVLCSYGYGDGGGGPTREMLENGRRMAKGVPGCPVVKQEFSRDYFDRLAAEVKGNKNLPKWVGELYLEFHRGTLTAQARNKKYNRKNELLYHDVETLCEMANALKGDEYPSDDILEAWKIILLNQFHDIIPGSSIAAVYEDSKEQYEAILASGRQLAKKAVESLAVFVNLEADSLVVFNTLGFDRDDVVITDMPTCCDCFTITDEAGVEMAWQKSFDGKLVFFAKGVPAKGYKAYAIKASDKKNAGSVNADLSGAETKFYSLKFDENMNITSLVHKESGRETVPEGEVLNRLIAYEDRPHNHEAWDVKCFYDEKFWFVDNVDSKEVVESGAVRTVVKVTRTFNLSKIEQFFIFYADIARVDIGYVLDWKEKHIILKTDNPVDVNASKATFDIQFGNIERTTHNNTTWDFAQFEVCGHKWADLSDNSFGLSILNDCKYGWTVKEGRIKPTLLRCATSPNHLQDREVHEFTFALYPHSGAVAASGVVNEGYSLNVPMYCAFAQANTGKLPAAYSFVKADADNIVIETVKKAEDSNCAVVRVYETWNRKTPCRLTFGSKIRSAAICNLLEEKDEELMMDSGSLELTFKPFEIKTVKVELE